MNKWTTTLDQWFEITNRIRNEYKLKWWAHRAQRCGRALQFLSLLYCVSLGKFYFIFILSPLYVASRATTVALLPLLLPLCRLNACRSLPALELFLQFIFSLISFRFNSYFSLLIQYLTRYSKQMNECVLRCVLCYICYTRVNACDVCFRIFKTNNTLSSPSWKKKK